jgi:hypothetical protein
MSAGGKWQDADTLRQDTGHAQLVAIHKAGARPENEAKRSSHCGCAAHRNRNRNKHDVGRKTAARTFRASCVEAGLQFRQAATAYEALKVAAAFRTWSGIHVTRRGSD